MNWIPIFKALGDASRLEIVRLLGAGPLTVTDLFTRLGISQPRVSRHLRILREAGLVATERDGRWVHVSLAADPRVSALVEAIAGKEPAVSRGRSPADRAARSSIRVARAVTAAKQESGAGPPGSENDEPEERRPGRGRSADIEEFLL